MLENNKPNTLQSNSIIHSSPPQIILNNEKKKPYLFYLDPRQISHDDIIGTTGTISLLSAYAILTNKLIENVIVIDILNIYGSIAVGYNCVYKKTYPPLVLELAWLIIASISLFKNIL